MPFLYIAETNNKKINETWQIEDQTGNLYLRRFYMVKKKFGHKWLKSISAWSKIASGF